MRQIIKDTRKSYVGMKRLAKRRVDWRAAKNQSFNGEHVQGQEIQKPIKDGKIIKSPKQVFRLTWQSSTGRRTGLNLAKASPSMISVSIEKPVSVI
jgi:hypothetical protein